jgi:DNA-binding transcriptional ArsR family regulator
MIAATTLPPAMQVFHALGDPTRRAIVEQVSRRPVSVSGLAEPLGITLTAVTQHLRILEACGLVRTQKAGRVRTCRLDTAGLDSIQSWIGACRSAWEDRLDRLGDLLEE